MMVVLSVPDDGYSECTWWWLFWAYLYTQNNHHQGHSEQPSSGTLRITIIRYTQNNHHQVLSEQPSSGTLRITFDDSYSECTWWWLFWVYLMMVILSVPDDGYSECTWWWLFWVYLMVVILSVPEDGYSESLRITIIRYAQNNHHQVHSE
jgi:hypothetical protein